MEQSASFEIKAELFPVNSSAGTPVKAVFHEDHVITIYDDENQKIADLDYDALKITDKIGSVPREISLPDLGLLVVESTQQTDYWLSKNGKYDKTSSMEKSRGFIIGASIGVPAFLYGFFAYLVPVIAIAFADIVPDSAVELASSRTMSIMDSQVLDKSDISDAEQALLLKEMHAVIDQLTLTTSSFNIQFRKSEFMGANAFALPNGTIVFTDEFIELVESDIDMIVAVLLHEIGHVEHKHSMRLIAETLATAIAVDFFLGDLGALVEFFAGVTNTVAQNQFSRELEWEADEFALGQLTRLGKEKDDFAKAMERLSRESEGSIALEKYLSSHPNMKERIMNARNKLEGNEEQEKPDN